MTVSEFLELLQSSDVKVWAEGERLRCDAPQGVLTPVLRAELARRKPEILAFLRAGATFSSSLVPIQAKGSRLPFFGIPGHNGDIFCYVRLAHYLGPDQPFFALQPPGYHGECAPFARVPELAAHYVREIRSFFPSGPYLLGGYCAGGSVAFEVAQQLVVQGQDVGMIALFESPFPTAYSLPNQVRNLFRYLLDRIPDHLRAVAGMDVRMRVGYFRDRVRGFIRQLVAMNRDPQPPEDEHAFRSRVAQVTRRAVRVYRPAVFPGRILLFVGSRKSLKQNYGRLHTWRAYAKGGLDLHVGPDGCSGDTMLREPYATFFADRLRECLDSRRKAGG